MYFYYLMTYVSIYKYDTKFNIFLNYLQIVVRYYVKKFSQFTRNMVYILLYFNYSLELNNRRNNTQ